MSWYLYLISLCMVAFAAAYIIYPERLLRKTRSMTENVGSRFLGIVPFILGVLLFVSAPYARAAALVVAIGFLACLKGVFLYFAPRDTVRRFMDWWFVKASVQTHRLLALIIYSVS